VVLELGPKLSATSFSQREEHFGVTADSRKITSSSTTASIAAVDDSRKYRNLYGEELLFICDEEVVLKK